MPRGRKKNARGPIAESVPAGELVHVEILREALQEIGGRLADPQYRQYIARLKKQGLIAPVVELKTDADQLAARRRVLALVARGLSETGACRYLGVNSAWLTKWKTEVAGFDAELIGAGEEASDMLEDRAFERAMDGSDDILKFLLKARRKKFTAQGQKGNPDERDLSEMTIGQLRSFVAAMANAPPAREPIVIEQNSETVDDPPA